MLGLCQFPGAAVLAVFPTGAQMALDQHLVPPPFQRPADVGTHLGLRHEHIQNVDAVAQGHIDHPADHVVALPFQMFAAQADLAGPQAGTPQNIVFHFHRTPLSNCFHYIPKRSSCQGRRAVQEPALFSSVSISHPGLRGAAVLCCPHGIFLHWAPSPFFQRPHSVPAATTNRAAAK